MRVLRHQPILTLLPRFRAASRQAGYRIRILHPSPNTPRAADLSTAPPTPEGEPALNPQPLPHLAVLGPQFLIYFF